VDQSFLNNPEVKKAFEDYSRAEWARLYKIICWIGLIAMPAGTTLDMNVYPAFAPYFLKLRLLSSLIIALFLGLFYSPFGRPYRRVLFLALPLVPQSFIAWMIYATEGPLSPYYAGLCVVLVAFCLVLPWTFQEIAGISLATILIYLAACVAHGGSIAPQGIFFSNFYFLTMTALFASIGSYFTSRLRVREFTNRYELDQNKRQLEETNQKLVELDQMKTRFFANISHELRTPLTLLIAPLEMLRKEKGPSLDGETQEVLKTMQENAMRLLKLINDLLDLVKLESGRMEVRKEALPVAAFFKGLALSAQGAARDKKIRLETRVDEGLGTVMADRDKLEKIVLNLLFNSIKFTPAGGKVELSARPEGDRLALRVTDTGMGISETDLPHIFDRFWQADSSAQRKYQGTGIGLSLVKELAEAQGGTVTAESRVGQGTTMTVRIPLEKASSAVEASGESQEEGTHRVQSSEWLEKLYRRAELFPAMTPTRAALRPDHLAAGKRPKVLVADDEPDMLRFLKMQLEKHFEVLEAVDGNQAVEKARQFLPDLAVLDMMMPEKDGIQACREIKKTISTQAIPVILLTARADDETKMAALEAGASDFLTKPFSGTELHVRVANLVETHRLQLDLARQKNALESALEQLKETEGLLVQNEKMASLGRLSAGIIHEINNPLNYATQGLYLLQTKKDRLPEEDRAKYQEIVSDIQEGVGRVQRIVSDLREFTHPHSTSKDLVTVSEILSATLRFLGNELKDPLRTEVSVPEDLTVYVDKNKMVQVFVNLVQNSVDALREKAPGTEPPLLSIRAGREGDRVRVSFRDNGTGIAPENLGKIFDPFFTTKEVGMGMGLGLSICYRILHEQGGEISVKSEKGSFTEFTLMLPQKG